MLLILIIYIGIYLNFYNECLGYFYILIAIIICTKKQRKKIKTSNKKNKSNYNVLAIDARCIEKYTSLRTQILNLQKKSDSELYSIFGKIEEIIAYINIATQQIKFEKINIQEFIINVLYEYKNIYSPHVTIVFNSKSKYEKIKLDSILIQKIIHTFINFGLKDSNGQTITVSIKDTMLIHPYYILDAIEVAFIFSFFTKTKQQVYALLNPSFNSITEIVFSKINRIVLTHSGKIDINISNSGNIKYSLVIPVNG